MLYNQKELPRVARTAGKVTILTALVGVFVFVAMFVVDFGARELSKVSAQQSATTTLTVLNTPPVFTQNAFEVTESSTTTPTNSGTDVVWNAIGTDSNGAPYFLLICDQNVTPTANSASSTNDLGTAPPECGAGAVQWAVSTATDSGTTAIAATTTTEAAPFNEVNDWYAWVCDDDPFNPRCVDTPVQGISATNSSPFHVNSRPTFTAFANNGPVDPGATVTFSSTSTDPDSTGGDDEIFLVVCQTTDGIDPVARTCNTGLNLASTSPGVTSDAAADYLLASIVRDANYDAYGYIVDEHAHEALDNPRQANFDVNNVAPQVLGSDIDLNGGSDILLTEAGGETTGFTLDFTISDANSCVNTTAGTSTGPFPDGSTELEIVDFVASVFRSGVSSTTCDGSPGSYDPNNCYPSGLATTTWNLDCTASSTSCGGATDDTIEYNCTFPLWFVADPTDSSSTTPAVLQSDSWSAAVSGVDDDGLTGPFATSTNVVDLIQFTAFALVGGQDVIAYGSLEPGDDTGTLNATTTSENLGNTGIDHQISGDSMCGTYTTSSTCPVSATSTIPESQQQFFSSEVAYSTTTPFGIVLSSTTPQEVELNIAKTTGTSSFATGITYWGIGVPLSIQLAGAYTGMNTYLAVTAEPADWGI